MLENTVGANLFAQLAMLLWIPIAVNLFYYRKPHEAAALAVIPAFLYLPELLGIKLPGIPSFDKNGIAMLGVWFGAILRTPAGTLWENRPRGIYQVLFWLGLLAPIGTVATNTEYLFFGKTILQGLGFADYRQYAFIALLDVMLPFWMGHALYRNPDQLRSLIAIIVGCALPYTVLAIIERGKGPLLNLWVWGYMQHDYFQTIRAGGFRPMVFTSHGITLAKFFAIAIVAGVTLARQVHGPKLKITKLKIAFIFAVLAISNSVGALIYGVVLGFMALTWPPNRLLRLGQILAVAFVLIPILRFSDVIPVTDIVQRIEKESADRAQSLGFRFHHEDMLMERVRIQPWFGWGGFSRNRVYNEAGVDESVTDGEWIIVLGVFGAVGAVAAFGPSVLAVVRVPRQAKKLTSPDDKLVVGGLAVALGMLLLDNIPNAIGGLPLNFLAGALAGCCAGIQGRSQASPQDG